MNSSNETPRSSALMTRLAPLVLLAIAMAACGPTMVTQREIDEALADCQADQIDAQKDLDRVVKEIARYVAIITEQDGIREDNRLIGACFNYHYEGHGSGMEDAARCIAEGKVPAYGAREYNDYVSTYRQVKSGRMYELDDCRDDLNRTRNGVSAMKEYAGKFEAAADKAAENQRNRLRGIRTKR